MVYLPLMVDMRGRSCVVIGGGRVAERKTAALLDAGAQVTVISPDVSAALAQWAEQGRMALWQRAYRTGDTYGAFLVVAATDRSEVNAQIRADALPEVPLIDMAERPETGNVIMPAVVRRGKLTLAVSTGGAGPALTRSIRERWEREFGAEYAEVLEFMQDYRMKAKASVKDANTRRRLLSELAAADFPELVRSGQWMAWKRQALARLDDKTDSKQDGGIDENDD